MLESWQVTDLKLLEGWRSTGPECKPCVEVPSLKPSGMMVNFCQSDWIENCTGDCKRMPLGVSMGVLLQIIRSRAL